MKKIQIYQLKETAPHGLFFTTLEDLDRYNLVFSQDNYQKVYEFYRENPDLEEIFLFLNRDDRPNPYGMHSLSVSDIVVVDDVAYYVCSGLDGEGFKRISWKVV